MTIEELLLIMPRAPRESVERDAAYLTQVMYAGDLKCVTRQAAFLGQTAVESGELRYWAELADGSAYEGRLDLGNTEPGDGKRFKGRGPIQLTGRHNYQICGDALGLDLVNDPEQVQDAEVGFRVAMWFWVSHGLNEKADKLDYVGITRTINGGLTHHDKRMAYYYRALEVLGRSAKVA